MKLMKICIVVLGMHRSGTSALTRVLNLVGCDLPKTIMGENASNKTGHWESDELVGLDDAILSSAGSYWHDWTEFHTDWYDSPKCDEFLQRAREKYFDEFGNSSLSVMKDPRICRILPFWKRFLSEQSIEARYVMPLRNPYEVAASLAKRDGFDVSYSLLIWLRYTLDGEYFSRGQKRVFTSFDSLINDWSGTVEKIGQSLDITWPNKSAKSAEIINRFIDNSEKHHSFESSKVASDHRTNAWLKTTYAILTKWEANGEAQSDYKALDKIRLELNDAAITFGPIIDQSNALREHVAGIEAFEGRKTSARISEVHEHYKSIFDNNNANLNSVLAKDKLNNAQIAQLEQALAEAKSEAVQQLEIVKSQHLNEVAGLNSTLVTKDEAAALTVADLNEQIAGLQSTLVAKDEAAALTVADLNEQIDGLQSTLVAKDEAAAQTVANLNEQIAGLQSIIVAKDEAAAQTVADLNEQIISLQSTLVAKDEAAALNVANLNEQIADLQSTLVAKDEAAAQTVNDLNEQLNRLEEASQSQISENHALVDALTARLAELSDTNDQLEAELQNEATSSQTLRADMESLKEQIEGRTVRVLALESELSETQGNVHFLESAMKQRTAELVDTSLELNVAKSRADGLMSDNESLVRSSKGLQEKLADQTKTTELLERRLADTQNLLQSTEQHNDEIAGEIVSIQTQLVDSERIKQNVIIRLIDIEQKLSNSDTERLKSLEAQERLIEQITHEERPFISLKRSSHMRKANLLRNAGIVDEAWYASQNPDVTAAQINPTLHYVMNGKKEGRKPRES